MTSDLPTAAHHWDDVYAGKAVDDVSWYRPDAAVSMRLVEEALQRTALTPGSAVDVGCGTSTLVDELLERGWSHVTGLDVSGEALEITRARLARRPEDAARADLVVTDLRAWRPERPFDLWHDRAVLHFLTDPADVGRYVDLATDAVRPGGALVLGTFGSHGPEQCSGLAVQQYDAADLSDLFAAGFSLLAHEVELHRTPWGSEQEFTWVTLVRR